MMHIDYMKERLHTRQFLKKRRMLVDHTAPPSVRSRLATNSSQDRGSLAARGSVAKWDALVCDGGTGSSPDYRQPSASPQLGCIQRCPPGWPHGIW